MRQYSHAARLADKRYTLLRREPLARHIGRGPPREIFCEGLRDAAGVAFVYKEPRDVRTGYHLAARYLAHFVYGDVQPERAQLFADQKVAHVAPFADIVQPLLQPASSRRYPVAQYMKRKGSLRRKFDPAEPLDPVFGAGPHKGGKPGGRIMVRQRQQRKSAPPRRRRELLRRKGTVGTAAVHVHINQDHRRRPLLRPPPKPRTYTAPGR